MIQRRRPKTMATADSDGGAEAHTPLSVDVDFDSALSFALCKLKSKEFALKTQQREAVKHVWEGKDVFVLLPTGFGKSLIYQVLPFIFDFKLGRMRGPKRSLVVVVSPLISLMADQVASLRRRGVLAAILSSRSSHLDKSLIATAHDFQTCSFLFGSPEALITSKLREQIDTPAVAERIVAIVIDEAHCVSKWYVCENVHIY